MDYPLISKNSKAFFPSSEICPICNTNRLELKSEFLVLNAGALKRIGKSSSIPSNELEGFLSIAYHPGEDSLDEGFKIDVVEDAANGQFDLYFCSASCMRQFFNQLVDQVEAKSASNPS